MGSDKIVKYRFLALVCLVIFFYPYVILAAILVKVYQKYFQKAVYRSVAGETALITGAARGLGKEIAIELAKKGCHVAIVDINEEEAEHTAVLISQKYGVKAKAYKVDVTNYDQVEELNKKVTSDLGPVTVLVNNAGILLLSETLNPHWREIQRMIDVNLTAHFWTTKVFLPKMKQLKRGNIVAISSLMGHFPLMEHAPYTSTKFAVRGLMSSIRRELKAANFPNIHLSTAFPLFLDTNNDVLDVLSTLKAQTLYPLIKGAEAARLIVQGMQSNSEDIFLPEQFSIICRLNELLPTSWQDSLSVAIQSVATSDWKHFFANKLEYFKK